MEAAADAPNASEQIVNNTVAPGSQVVESAPQPISLDDRLLELEASLITWALNATHGNKSRAAELLQIKRSTLGDRIKRCREHVPPLTGKSAPATESL